MSDVDVTMPQLGETVAEGTISRWLVEEGGEVTADEPLLEVSTDKVDTEVVAPVSGLLRAIVVGEGETVPVGTLLATIGTGEGPGAADQVPDTDRTEETLAVIVHSASLASPSAVSQAAGSVAAGSVAAGSADRSSQRRHVDSPRVRRLARDLGVDLGSVPRTGGHGRATPEDVLAAAGSAPGAQPAARSAVPAPPPTPAPAGASGSPRGRVVPLSRRRRVIAERMHRSLQESAQLTTVVDVDLSSVVKAKDAAKDVFRARHGVSLSVLAYVAEAAVQSLADHPVVHAELDLANGTVTHPFSVELGIAVDTDEGLVVPVIRRADDLTVGALARRIAELAGRARDGSATADDFAGGTFTITNTGSRGALFDTPILNAPQSAILGLGAVVRRPVAMASPGGGELIAIRSVAYLSLTYDHRLVDGADAARYLVAVKQRLETPGRSWADAVGVQEESS